MFCDSMMLGGGRKAAFSIANSVRLDGVADYFTRTPTVAGNRQVFTIAFWSKCHKERYLFSCGTATSRTSISFNGYALQIVDVGSGAVRVNKITTALYRDPTAWRHICVTFDNGTVRLYVNGAEVTSFATNINTLGTNATQANHTSPQIIGDYVNLLANGYSYDGCMAEFILVDGTALPPSAFGETDPITRSWRPKRISGLDFGTNGFHLDFNDPADLGKDVSGKGNAWAPVSLGTADVVSDTPTNNYPVLNPLHKGGYINLSNGNLSLQNTYPETGVSNWQWVYATLGLPATGKWGYKYKAETTITSDNIRHYTGAVNPNSELFGHEAVINAHDVIAIYGDYSNGTHVINRGIRQGSASPRINSGDDIEILFNCDEGSAIFKINGTQIGNTITGLSFDGMVIFAGNIGTGSSVRGTVDFGQLGYTPSDVNYKALCTANLPKPAVQAPAKHMDVVTYTGTGAPQTITGLGFAPDLVWVKARSNPTASWLHRLTSRGLTQPSYLSPNSTDAETSIVGNITSLDANGFTINGNGGVGESGVSHVAWCWKAGGAPVANSAGTIASAVSVNPAAGFSIVTWDGDAANATIGHGLGAAPKFIIAKCRSAGGTDWSVYIGALAANTKLSLSGTNAAAAGSDWNSTAPTATVFSVGASANTNADGHSYIAYCWAEIPGFSKFASYSGNGSSDGPFVHCGFRPRFVLIKRTDAAGNWSILDTERSPANDGTWESLQANSALPESGIAVDGVSSGFKIREAAGDINASGGTYIFAAFAEAPFGGIKTVPAKAR